MTSPKAKLKNKSKGNIFYTYLITFVAIFLVGFLVLGSSLIILVSAYSINEKTNLLTENTETVASSISNALSVSEMNSNYSRTKEAICESLLVVSTCIDADLFVCDTGGNVIMCKESTGISAYKNGSLVCSDHTGVNLDDKYIQRAYEGTTVTKAKINGKKYYFVGTKVTSTQFANNFDCEEGKIIGTVFAVSEAGTTSIISAALNVFIVVSILCFVVGFVCIYNTTKRITSPLQQMSDAAKMYAAGDFSYRVNISGNDELSHLGNSFNQMADALDKLESSRRSFVANVSHELKTPMTSIAGYIDGIIDGTIKKEKQDYYLKVVSNEVRRLSRLVFTMLNMSKMESGDFEINLSNYDITKQIIPILITFEQKIENKNIDIRGLDDLSENVVFADPDMIYQVIYNLIDNAVKFTNENGYIEFKATEDNGFIFVTIKNS